jgi:lipopolysaccharide biosynthesis protein
LRRFHDERYVAFSELLWANFDDALPYFPESSIDLLHIDGLHTYEAVEHDFESWRPKLSDRAVVLFHDTNVRERNFGVWKLWGQLHRQFPSFEFLHEHGLGVLAVGPSVSSEVLELCSLHDPAKVQTIRQRFSLLGERWSFPMQLEPLKNEATALKNEKSSLVSELTAANAQVSSLGAEAANRTSLEQEITALRNELTAAKAQVSSLVADATHRTSLDLEIRTRAVQRAAQARDELASLLATGLTRRSIPLGERRPARSQAPVPELFECQTMQQNGRIAVVLHLHYTELWQEFEQAISSITEPFDLFVTVTTTDTQVEESIRAAFPQARILHFENRGRDILPFVILVNSGVLFRYELICKLHTKRSLHRSDGDHWRKVLVSGVLGGTDLVHRIVDAFDHDPDLGIVVADGQIYGWDPAHWAGNLERLHSLGPEIGIEEIPDTSPFPGGSVYWIRPFLLRHLRVLELASEDFEPEPLPADGTTAHAVERLLGLICKDAGMRIKESSALLDSQRPETGSNPRRPHLVAFYLPQYHPIPENDMWWGPGFTEWFNVARATSMFRHHRQPRLPADLGFYDLRLPDVRHAHAELAKHYGLSAFCYYYYWFNGRLLLNRPLDEVLQSGSPDFPFMICWANESWSRNWDGGNREILVQQTYNENWPLAFARDIAPILKDQRYFRLDGKPVVLIYRVMHIPDCADALSQLRIALQREGVEEVYLVAGWFGIQGDQTPPTDARQIGLDSYFEFPPHSVQVTEITEQIPDKDERFTGHIYSYESAVESGLANLNNAAGPERYKGVMVGWDNTARRVNDAYVVQGSTPSKFRRWLRQVVVHESQYEHSTNRIVFINAWNEWAEGTYLEPDRDYGHGWLEAVASAAGRSLKGEERDH